jgi:hypothetical protein
LPVFSEGLLATRDTIFGVLNAKTKENITWKVLADVVAVAMFADGARKYSSNTCANTTI